MKLKLLCITLAGLLSLSAIAEVSYERIRDAADEPGNWLTYNGGYASQRHRLLEQLNKEYVQQLELKWMLQNQVAGAWLFLRPSSIVMVMALVTS